MILNILPYRLLISSDCAHIIPTTPEIPVSTLVLEIHIFLEYHYTAFPFEIPHDLRYVLERYWIRACGYDLCMLLPNNFYPFVLA